MRLRFQLPVGIVIAALIPYIIRYYNLAENQNSHVINNTLLGLIFAISLGAWLMRNIAIYPGSEALSSTLPSFSVSFAILIIAFIFARIPYNRVTLFSGFAISFLWFFVMAAIAQRRRLLRIGVVALGNASLIHDLPNISVRLLHFSDEPIENLDAIAADLRIDLPSEWDRKLADYALARIPVYHIKHLAESLTGRVELEHLSENSFGSLTPRYDYMVLKSIIDWIFALFIGLAILPALILVGIIVKLSSPGPALFRQIRMGYEGRPFTMYKFRTMKVVEIVAGDERAFAITKDSDDRITSVGRFLRKTRIDELPQLLNILRGEMSWIGPRPEALALSHWYEEKIPFYRYRHVVRPGIAGWAQVCQGHVAEVDEVRNKLNYDFYYIKQYSPWIDLLIVVRTMWTVISGHGAR